MRAWTPEPLNARVGSLADRNHWAKMAGMRYDQDHLEACAAKLKAARRDRDAMAVYRHMADGDPSLDGGYLAMQIGACERLGDLHLARWWYGRAGEENPSIDGYLEARQRLEHIGIVELP